MIFWMKNQGVKREKRIIMISIIIIIIIIFFGKLNIKDDNVFYADR